MGQIFYLAKPTSDNIDPQPSLVVGLVTEALAFAARSFDWWFVLPPSWMWMATLYYGHSLLKKKLIKFYRQILGGFLRAYWKRDGVKLDNTPEVQNATRQNFCA